MRLPAFILLFPFTVFLAETASFIPTMQENCTIAASRKSSCCMKTKKPTECQGKNDTGKKDPGNKCTGNPGCTTCPVCYSFIFQAQYEWESAQFFFKKNYGSLHTRYMYSYTPHVWKPPNRLPYSV